MTMKGLIRTAVLGAALLATACVTTTGEIEGHKVRGTAEPTVYQLTVADGLHAHAPQWFKDGWSRYLRDADGRYAVLAVDRNARGWGYVYCRAADCHALEGAGHQSHKDLRYKHKALDLCRGNVREYQPAHRPNCAIYAIKDKIVWEGKMPWE